MKVYRLCVSLLFCLLPLVALTAYEEEPIEVSTPEQIATLSNSSDFLIGGLVSPLSGQLCMRHTDLIARGAQDVTIGRIYVPPHMPCSFQQHKKSQDGWDKRHLHDYLRNNYRGWRIFRHLWLYATLQDKRIQLRITDPLGITLDFRLAKHKDAAQLITPPYAISNIYGDIPSGKYDPRNTRVHYEDAKITVYAPDGATRVYIRWGTAGHFDLFALDKEILPSGKVLRYRRDPVGRLTRIEAWDPKERYNYATVSGDFPSEGQCYYSSSSGIRVDYRWHQQMVRIKIKEKHHQEDFNLPLPGTLIFVSSPFFRHESIGYTDRLLLSSYSGLSDIFTCQYDGFDPAAPHFRISKLFLPVEQSDGMHPVYEMSYSPPAAGVREGTTTVKNSDGSSAVYHFSKDLLTTAIQYFGEDRLLKKEKLFFWHGNNWLRAIEIRDGKNNALSRRSYIYDDFGNPTGEKIEGNLTGEGKVETYCIKREFTQDGRNLLLKEELENGKVTCFSYLPNTNLITSKLTKDGAKILLREFFVYDDYNNLVEKIEDDGTGEEKSDLSCVTQRTITEYLLRQQPPFLHMPEWIEEKCLEGKEEKLLKRVHLTYDEHGNVEREDVYDADRRFAYSISKKYNERGDLLSETNALGQEAQYTYDSRGRCETALNFGHTLQTKMRYDAKGRLREKQELGSEGAEHLSLSEYDFLDRLIHKIDDFGNSTRYAYDPVVSRAIKTESPPILSIENSACPVITHATFDALGRATTKTDANGNITRFHYNMYGSPTLIIHPDETTEQFRYTRDGELQSYTDQDGLTVIYTRDVLGRVLLKSPIFEGKSVAEETFTYSGFNLLTSTDKEGHLTTFTYDGAGRKIREERCGKITVFVYDSLGRLAEVHKQNDENTLVIRYTRDLLDRVIEETKTDQWGVLFGKIAYTYDEDGNQKTIERSIQNNLALETFSYDPFHRLLEHRDALGYSTTISYDEECRNSLGQRVLQKKTIDPRNITTIETHDPYGRLAEQSTFDPQNVPIASQEKHYDFCGNLILHADHVYMDDKYVNTQFTRFSYNCRHQLLATTRAFNSPDARVTKYSYTPSGKISTKTESDGTTLNYAYDPFGFLQTLHSSDRQIDHAFTYNRLGHLLATSDNAQKITIQREVDPNGNILRETFPHGQEIEKSYDAFDRPLTLRIYNQGAVHYTYDSLFLRSLSRVPTSREEYTHSFDDYDLDGNLLTETLIQDLGQIKHTTDLKGRKTALSSPYFSQSCEYDPSDNLISTQIDDIQSEYTYDGLSQLTRETESSYGYDSLYNRTQKNDQTHPHNDLNQLTASPYDDRGNQLTKTTPDETFTLTYDPLNRLTQASSENTRVLFTYDPLGRRLSKIVHRAGFFGWKETTREYYLYDRQNEIAAFAGNTPTSIRITTPGQQLPSTIALELDSQLFVPLLDCHGNIRRLINPYNKKTTSTYNYTAFGEHTPTYESPFNPWRYASKRLDPELNLIYFGKRYYDPTIARWLTTDPAGSLDSTNLYQYLFNNPFRYTDPDGQFAFAIPLITWGIELLLPAITTYIAPIIYGAAIGVASYYGGSAFANAIGNNSYYLDDPEPMMHWVNELNKSKAKNSDVYAPDRPLPRDPRTAEPIPETNTPHTELGTRDGREGKYPQAREFDGQGKPVRDIDFTDHGRPQDHPSPHQHPYNPNPTGGTPSRSKDGQPVPEWRYD